MTNLNKWQNIMELTGYKIEGVHKDKFVKGMIISDVMTISCPKYHLYLKNVGSSGITKTYA